MPEYKITEDDYAVHIPSGSTARFTPLKTCIGSILAPETANGKGAYAGHFMNSKVNRSLVFFEKALKYFGDPEGVSLYTPLGGLFSKDSYKIFLEGLTPREKEIAPSYMDMATTHFNSIIKFMNIVKNSGIPEENMHIRWSPPGSLTDFSFNAGTNENEIIVCSDGKELYTGSIEDAPEPIIPEMQKLNKLLKG